MSHFFLFEDNSFTIILFIYFCFASKIVSFRTAKKLQYSTCKYGEPLASSIK